MIEQPLTLESVVGQLMKEGVEESKAKKALEKYVTTNTLETKRLMRKLRKQANREKQQALQSKPKEAVKVVQSNFDNFDPKFLVAGQFLIPIVVDKSLKDNEFRLVPPLTQNDIDRWIADNPEKARKMLADAKEAMEACTNQSFSISYSVNS